MHIYFVRHGQTDLNLQFVHQSPSTPLNARGLDQARSVGEELRPMNATLLVTSPYERAAQTARVVGFCVGLTPVYSSLFYEVERPSLFAGSSLFGIRTLWYLLRSVIYRNNPNWRYKDGENFFDIFSRIQKSFAYIESLCDTHKSVIIVSHSAYISLMIRYMCDDGKLSLTELVLTLLSINKLKNCAIHHVEYVGPTAPGTCGWIQK